MTAPVLAAIDCGTNSTRLLVSRGGAETLDRLMSITRLGRGWTVPAGSPPRPSSAR